MMSTLHIFLLIVSLLSLIHGYHSTTVNFENGVNQAWVWYGYDFGNNNQANGVVINTYDSTLQTIATQNPSSSTKGAIRVWVHCGADSTPQFGSSGQVIATDAAGTFLDDIGRLLNLAQTRGVPRVWLTLWNLALYPSNPLLGLIWDAPKLQSYFNVVLIPLLQRFANHPSLAGIDIVNEPEGSLAVASSSNACQDTSFLSGSGAGWTGAQLPMLQLQTFVAKHASVIHTYAPNLEITVGSWNARVLTDAMTGARNLWKDACLSPLGGTLTMYHAHTYAYGGVYDQFSPFLHTYADYALTKPLIVAEFSQNEGAGMTSAQQYAYLYCKGYAGALGWQALGTGSGSDSLTTLSSGMGALPAICSSSSATGVNVNSVSFGLQYSSSMPVLSSTSLTLSSGNRVVLLNGPSNQSPSSSVWATFGLLGKTFSFELSLSAAGCGCNVALSLVALAGQASFCDSAASEGRLCPEIALFEGNSRAVRATSYCCCSAGATCNGNYGDQCLTSTSSSYSTCDAWGISYGYGGNSGVWGGFSSSSTPYGPSTSYVINTLQQFTVSTTFQSSGSQLTGIYTTLSQNGNTISLNNDHPTLYLQRLSPLLAQGMGIAFSFWTSSDMTWMDGGSAGCTAPESCPSAASAVFSNLRYA